MLTSFHRFLESSAILFAIIDPVSGIAEISPAWHSLTGYAAADLSNKSFLDLIHADDRDEFRQALATEIASDCECRLLCKDGRLLRLQCHLMRDGDHVFLSAYSAVAFQQGTAWLEVKEFYDFVFVFDIDGMFVGYHEPEGVSVFPDIDQFIGKPVENLLPNNIGHQMQDAINVIKKTGLAQRLQFRLNSAWYEARLAPRVGMRGETIGFVAVVRDNTYRKRVEESLIHTQLLYQTLLDNLPGVGAILFDRQFKCLLAGGQALLQAGFNKYDMIGKPIGEILNVNEAAFLHNAHQQVFAGKSLNFHHVHQDRTYAAVITPVGTDDQAMLILTDITQQEQSKKALEANLARSQLLYQTSQDLHNIAERQQALKAIATSVVDILQTYISVIVIFDPETHDFLFYEIAADRPVALKLETNQFWEGLSGWAVEHEQPAISPKHAPDPREAEHIQRSRAQLAVGSIIIIPIYSGGQIIGTLSAMNHLDQPDFSTEDVNILTVIANQAGMVLEKLLLIETLTKREASYRQLVDHAAEIVYRMDASGYITFTNQAIEKMTGYTIEETLGKHFSQLIHPDHKHAAIAFFGALHQSRSKEAYYEYPVICKDGSIIWIGQNTHNIYEKGIFVGAEAIARDITSRKQVEQEREQLIQELDAFSHTVAHDLKAPLSVSLGFAELLRESEDLTDADSELAQHVVRANIRLQKIIDELLKFASLRREREVPVGPVNMLEPILASLERLVLEIKKYDAQIDISDHIPPALGYSPWIEEIWTNYISNAIKYGGRPPIVSIFTELQPDGTIRYCVADNGPGIPAEQQKDLFKEFARLSEIRVSGTGLGLSIVKRIANQLSGVVGVESQPGQGSTFWFTLPLAKN